MENYRDLIPDSKFLQNHLLIDPVAALLEREEIGYRDLRKALVGVYMAWQRSCLMADMFLLVAKSDPG